MCIRDRPEILWREKAAFSDAVGHSMVDDIKEYAESLYTEEEFQICLLYTSRDEPAAVDLDKLTPVQVRR